MYYGRDKTDLRNLPEIKVTWECFTKLCRVDGKSHALDWAKIRKMLGIGGSGPLRLIPR